MRPVFRGLLALVTAVCQIEAQSGAYTLNGGSASTTGQTYRSTTPDESPVYVLGSGILSLGSPTIEKAGGNTSNTTKSSQYGLNAGLLVTSSGKVTITGGTVVTNASGANGLFATGTGSTISMTGGSITTTAEASHGVDVTYGGVINLVDTNIQTSGDSASAGISTDFGGGTVNVTGGNVVTAGSRSPAIYSTGVITVTGVTMSANGGPGGVIDGANTINLVNSTLVSRTHGIRSFRSAPGSGSATINVNGGAMTANGGELFYVTTSAGANSANITVRGGAQLSASTGNILLADTGSTATLVLDGETVTGNIVAKDTSSVSAKLLNGTVLTGASKRSAISLDSTSAWVLTANSEVTTLAGAAISANEVTNIKGNGFTLYYDGSAAANAYLGGQVYNLAKGGVLAPAGTVIDTPVPPAITAVTETLAPGSLGTIAGSNLANTKAAVTADDLAAGFLPDSFQGASVTVDGERAFIYAASPEQISFVAPGKLNPGDVTVTVTTSVGSGTFTAKAAAVQPGIISAAGYAMALRPVDGVAVVGASLDPPHFPPTAYVILPAASTAAYSTTPAARPGDTLSIFATGLGPATVAIAEGLVFTGSYALAQTPAVSVGGSEAEILSSALISPGLYQVTFRLPPDLAAGDYEVVLTQGEAASKPARLLIEPPK